MKIKVGSQVVHNGKKYFVRSLSQCGRAKDMTVKLVENYEDVSSLMADGIFVPYKKLSKENSMTVGELNDRLESFGYVIYEHLTKGRVMIKDKSAHYGKGIGLILFNSFDDLVEWVDEIS